MRHLYVLSQPWASLNHSSIVTATTDPLPIGRLPSAEEHPLFYVGVFACIGLGVVFISILGQITLAFGSYRASKILFS
jgi:hypothetical protein